MLLRLNSIFWRISILTLITIIHKVSLQCPNIPADSTGILNSVPYSNMAPIPGFETFNIDAISYNYTYVPSGTQMNITGEDTFQYRIAMGVGSCGPVYPCCFSSGITIIPDTTEEKNWLVSDHYMTDAQVIQVQILCDKIPIYPVADCRTTSQVYYYESDNAVTIDSAVLSEFSLATNSINQAMNDKLIHASFTKAKKGFYIGVLNNGYCAQISAVQIFYSICPSLDINQLNSLPETPVPTESEEPTAFNLSCPVGSVSFQQAECYSNGSWRVPESVECVCERGWREVTSSSSSNLSCVACPENTYKNVIGNERECVSCPEMSSTNGMTASVMCECDDGWYRSEEESVDVLCGRSPSVVRNIRLERGTESVEETRDIRVVWEEPVDVWGRSVSYNVSLYSDGLWWSGRGTENLFYELSESELGESSREYLLEVTPLNTLSVLSGVENKVSVRFVSRFPEVVNGSLRWNPSGSLVEWEYNKLEGGVSELSFELNYTSIGGEMRQERVNGCSPVSPAVYRCSVTVIELDESMDILLTLIPLSSNEIGDTLSQRFNLITAQPPSNSDRGSLVGFIVTPAIILLFLFILTICLVIGLCFYRRRRRTSTFDYEFPLKSYPQEKLYQDPGLYNDLNTAVRRFAKEIDHEELEFLDNIGEGEFADVCRGILKKQGQRIDVAIKILKPNALLRNKEDFLSEASIMGQFKHPNVIFLYGVTLNKPIVIVTPFMENGSLDDFLKQREFTMTAIQKVAICIGVASGMEYFTKIGFVHRDLAARNVLIDIDWTPKISDFGLSRETEESFYNVRTGGKIPIRWTAPEAIAYRKFNEASDVWSFGVLVWEVTSYGKVPYSGIENFDVLGEVQAGYRLEKPDSCPATLYDLMLTCWRSDCDLRPKFTDIKMKLNDLIDSNFGTKLRNRQNRSSFIDPKTSSLDGWLSSINLPRYITNFQEGGYCYLAQIYSMTNEDLINLGILPVGHRVKILNSISEMHSLMLGQVNMA